jgi:Sulfatase
LLDALGSGDVLNGGPALGGGRGAEDEKPAVQQLRELRNQALIRRQKMTSRNPPWGKFGVLAAGLLLATFPGLAGTAEAQQKRPNIVILMTDDTGWNDFGAYTGGGAALGHPTPNIDRVAQEGALFTSWYGQASCTAGRASLMTGRIPVRSALSVVVVPGDPNGLRKETPTVAEFFKKNGYGTYFSGKWHLGDKPEFYPIEHGFDEMKNFAAYYPGVYSYSDTSHDMHPWFPKYNAE